MNDLNSQPSLNYHSDRDMNRPRITRRGLVRGLGVAGVAGAAALVVPASASAAPAGGTHLPGPADGKRPDATPGRLPTPIASAPIAGYTYVYLDMFDFTPENSGNGRAWSLNGGMFTPLGGNGMMWATAQLPPGAFVGDTEWYVYSSQNNTELMTLAWVAGQPQMATTISDALINADPSIRAVRIPAPSTSNGPFPAGVKIALAIRTYSDQSVVINGARIGYTMGPTGSVLLPAPVRVYDSRAGSKIEHGQTRTHSLAGRIPVGAVGVILNVTITGTEQGGFLTVYSASAVPPGTSSMNWSASGQTIANGVQTAVSGARSIRVMCGGNGAKTHYLLDLVGYLV
jgi:hypothetical protein